MKIKSIEKYNYDGKVYNIGTMPDHNYYAESILVHNCYMDSDPKSAHVMDAVDKIQNFFGPMTMNQRPFQVALGGGNPNEHPHFVQILEKFDELNITPNYTTNGMGLTEEVLEATEKYCGGVAVSCHAHLEETWKEGITKLGRLQGLKLSYHHIISDIESADRFLNIFESPEWDSLVKYHVLLPQVAQGRAKNSCDREAVKYLFGYLGKLESNRQKKVAFGARFYEDLVANEEKFPGISLYGPEDFSKFLDLKDMRIYPSSFDATAEPAIEANA